MTCNTGHTERIIRAVIGVLVLVAGFYYGSWWGLLGLAPITTAVTGYCPINAVLGINNCRRRW